jgi:hypothetical protein
MRTTALGTILLAAVLAGPPAASCGEASLEALKQRCEEAREREIAPLRQAGIEECVSDRRSNRTREDCERIYEGFGQGGGTVGGGFRTRLFNDLPECTEYFRARNAADAGRSRR